MSQRGLWRFPIVMLHVASRGSASEGEISSLVGHFTFRALVRRELLAISVRLALALNAGAVTWLIVACRHRGVARHHCLMPLHGVVRLSLLRSSCGSERNGPLQRSLAILSPTEILTQRPVQCRRNTSHSSSTIRTSASVVVLTATSTSGREIHRMSYVRDRAH